MFLDLSLVENQTEEICLAALKSNPKSEQYIRIPFALPIDFLIEKIEKAGKVL